jgi:DNA invertase Pin-like site-specific DNA recombinase
MDKPSKKLLRCAIYTRKSTEHNLDLEFNSLDAQREACEAYVKSQTHEGWHCIHDRYDDGAFSGASLDRPALQQLLAKVRAGKIDVIVVYKVDRLTRSLADFAKLVELFDGHGVSFVSVTQSFNTTSSMGRLTLNVLLSFAQFEREVIGERVRDKIAASKRKGIWVGGPVPLGYASVSKKIVVVPKEAETVRFIFRRYLELESTGALIQDLDRNGIRTKRQTITGGRIRGGIPFRMSSLTHLLHNRFYIGEIFYRGAIHPGEHAPILDRDLFEAVQAKLAANSVERRLKLRASPAILVGRLFDDRGNRMTPSHSNKRGVRYRYYISQAIVKHRRNKVGRISRVPAPEIEAIVLEALRKHLAISAGSMGSATTNDRDLVERHLERIIITPDAIELYPAEPNTKSEDEISDKSNAHKDAPAQTKLILPWSRGDFRAVKGILHIPSQASPMAAETSDVLLAAIAKARDWINDLVEGRARSFTEIATREGKVERHIRFLAPLAFLSPKIISAIVRRTAPADLTVTDLAKGLPLSWTRQEHQIGLRITTVR